jgi:NAD dependent epimerase/dehydratase family
VAGFIGMHVARRLLEHCVEVVGIDNLNDYYDVRLKEDLLKQLASFPNFRFVKLDMAAVGFEPRTPLKEGVEKFVARFKSYYGAAACRDEVRIEVKVQTGFPH